VTNFVNLAFYKTNDFLVLDTPERVVKRFRDTHASLPFELEGMESQELAERVEKVAAATAELPVHDKPDMEEEEEAELQLEQEQQAELQIQRLKEDQHFNEDMFSLNPAQLGPMYALCDEMHQPSLATKQGKRYHPCVPVSSWLAGEHMPKPSRVYASYSFVLVQPAPRKTVPWWELFEKPWNYPASDHAQSSDYDDSVHLLQDDTRKNVRNVLFMVNREDPADFQFVLVSSTEALHLVDFCSSDRSNMYERFRQGVTSYAARFEDKLKAAMICEDAQRLRIKDGPFKDYNPLLDHFQQYYAYFHDTGDAPTGQSKDALDFQKYVATWWGPRDCTIFDPRALPTSHGDDFLKHLLPQEVLAMVDNQTRDSYKTALVEVLALAGAQALLNTEVFKQEFKHRMEHDAKFQEVFIKVRQSMGLPFDPLEFAFAEGESSGTQAEFFIDDDAFEESVEEVMTIAPKKQATKIPVDITKQVDLPQKVPHEIQTGNIRSASGAFKHQDVSSADQKKESPQVVKTDLLNEASSQTRKELDRSPTKSQPVQPTVAKNVNPMPGSEIYYEDISKRQVCHPECGCKETVGPEIMAGIVGEMVGRDCLELCSKDVGCVAFSQFRRKIQPPDWDACRLYTTNYEKYRTKEFGTGVSWFIPRYGDKDWKAIATPTATNRIGLPSNCMVKRRQSEVHEPLPQVQGVHINPLQQVQEVHTTTSRPQSTTSKEKHDVQLDLDIRPRVVEELGDNCYAGDGGGRMIDSSVAPFGICASLKDGRPEMMPNLFKEFPQPCLETAKEKCEMDSDCYAVSAAKHARKRTWTCRVHTTSNDFQLYSFWAEPISRKRSEIGCPKEVFKLDPETWQLQTCIRKVAK